MLGLTIGRVAKQVGMSRDAIRIYERLGLIDESSRTASGYRLYSEADVARLRFIKQAKVMGFSLKEIGELLKIKRTTKNSCGLVRTEAKVKLKQIETKMAELERLQNALKRLIRTCDSNKTNSHCPLLDALEIEDLKGKQP